MATYRILSLDGGGIRGLVTAVLMERLLSEAPGWLDKVDLVAGTSTGGIIALGLANGLTPAELHNFYYQKGKRIFDDSWADDIRDLGGLTGADYDNIHLKEELANVFGSTLLKQLRKRVLISAFDLNNDAKRCWKPKFFHNFEGSDSDGERRAADVALYTSAAPTFFPTADRYIDGGVVANNPGMAALAQTQDTRTNINPRPAIHDIVLLSLGTGQSLCVIEGKNLDWGYAHWARALVNIMIDGSVGVADYQCRQILREKYFRLNPTFPPGKQFNLDDVAKMDDMIAFAENSVDISSTVEWLGTYWA